MLQDHQNTQHTHTHITLSLKLSPTGLLDPIEGAVQLRNLRFTFPSRPTDEVIRGINCTFPAGTIVGVVGQSGAGKSTLISLIERFYDPTSGAILIDGKDAKRCDDGVVCLLFCC
jgi:ATP-binding cassette subfamily B (MDR/TAP) protein 1